MVRLWEIHAARMQRGSNASDKRLADRVAPPRRESRFSVRICRRDRREDKPLAAAASFLLAGSPSLRAAQPPGQLPHVELVHLVLQGAQWDAKVLGRPGDIPAVLFE